MTVSVSVSVVLFVLFVVWLVMALVKSEFRGSDFWWKALVGVAVIATFGLPAFR